MGHVADEVAERLRRTLDRIGELQAGPRVSSDAVLSQPFVHDHTEFESFETFCEESPWSLDDPSDIRDVPREELDDYVADTTDCESWEQLTTLAAEEEIIDQAVA